MVPCYAESLLFKLKNSKLRKSESVRGYVGAIEYPVCSKAKHSKVDHQHLIVFNAAYQFLHWAVAPARVFERNKFTDKVCGSGEHKSSSSRSSSLRVLDYEAETRISESEH